MFYLQVAHLRNALEREIVSDFISGKIRWGELAWLKSFNNVICYYVTISLLAYSSLETWKTVLGTKQNHRNQQNDLLKRQSMYISCLVCKKQRNQAYIYIERERERERGRGRGRARETERQRERQRDRERQRERLIYPKIKFLWIGVSIKWGLNLGPSYYTGKKPVWLCKFYINWWINIFGRNLLWFDSFL